jgi:hypothetical protein
MLKVVHNKQPFTKVLLSIKIVPKGFSILVNIVISPKYFSEYTMLEDPLKNGPLPLFIEILVTVENAFLNSTRNITKTFQLPPQWILTCVRMRTKMMVVGKKQNII